MCLDVFGILNQFWISKDLLYYFVISRIGML